VLHPVLLAASPVLAQYWHNRFEVGPPDVWPALLACMGAALGLGMVLAAIQRDRLRAGFMVSALVVLGFSYGPIHDLVQGIGWGGMEIGRHRHVLAGWLLAVAGVLALVARMRRDLAGPTRVANIAAAATAAAWLVALAAHEATGRVRLDRSAGDRVWEERQRGAGAAFAAQPPDIYYIVLDRYAGAGTLQRDYGYDNSAFVRFLESRGFYVAQDARCNYPGTFLSLASTLNMSYLDDVREAGRTSRDRRSVYDMVRHNKVQRQLREAGYRYVHVGNWWEPTRFNPHADRNVEYAPGLSEFSEVLLRGTVLGPVLWRWIDRVHTHGRRIRFQFEAMTAVIDAPGPKFVFFHSLVGHDPFVFDRQGREWTDSERARRPESERYVDQIVFTTTMVQQLLERILARSPRPPIIVLASDEGPPVQLQDGRPRLDAAAVATRTGILNAYHLPGVPRTRLHPALSPVNSFRLVFDLYFGTEYGLLADRTFCSEDAAYLYRFVEVTQRTP
jgi:hypothetical protein